VTTPGTKNPKYVPTKPRPLVSSQRDWSMLKGAIASAVGRSAELAAPRNWQRRWTLVTICGVRAPVLFFLSCVGVQHSPFESAAQMKKLILISTLLLAASPGVAQVASSQAPTTGVECTLEMTATFCNVPSGPSEGGYGSGLSSGGVSTLSSASGASNASGTASGTSGVSVSIGVAGGPSSIPPCPSEPAFNELCN
jgi:hypothetical protein